MFDVLGQQMWLDSHTCTKQLYKRQQGFSLNCSNRKEIEIEKPYVLKDLGDDDDHDHDHEVNKKVVSRTLCT